MNYKTNLFRQRLPRRIFALILTVCMVFTMMPPFTATAEVTDSGRTILLSGFDELANEVREQSVPIGTSSVELNLPDTLEAYPVAADYVDEEEIPPDFSKPEEELPPAKSNPEEPESSVTDSGTPSESSSSEVSSTPAESSSAPESAPSEPPSESSEPEADEATNEEAEPAPDASAATEDTSGVDEPATQVLSAYVESDITEADEDTTTSAAITVEGVTWESEPEYNGDIAGTYIFTAVLPDGYTVEGGAALPTITVMVGHILEYGDCMDFDCPTHYPPEILEEMNEDEDPVPLTLTDLVEDYGVETPPARRTRAAPNPQTLVVTTDNENNAHTGTADRDMDADMTSHGRSHPIEISFNIQANKMPTQSAFLAVKAFDVDEDYGETDYVYLNDDIYLPKTERNLFGKLFHSSTIGYLSGTNITWNTTVLEVPLEKLKPGNNVISITVATGWVVEVDWMQLVLDGGAKDANIDSFSLKLGDPVNSSDAVQVPATVTIKQNGSIEYVTEYSLIQTATGNALDAKFGKAQEQETVSLSMPLNAQTGTYKIIGILKDPATEVIKARDEVAFEFTQNAGAIVAPKMAHTLTPSELTKQSVDIAVSVTDANGYTDITIQDGGRKTVAGNGDYDFTVSYKYNGTARTMTYTVPVTNIDKTPPTITYTPLTVAEETSDEEIAAMFKAALVVTDGRQLASGMPIYTLLPANIAATYGTRDVTVTATDAAGNTATQNCLITVTPLPLKLAQSEPARVGTTNCFTLSALLKNTGGDPITETGFVWGAMQSPTTTVNNGKLATASAVTTKGGTVSGTAADIADGVNYYARPYAVADGKTYYGEQKPFSIGGKQYGAFAVANNSDNTFTITRIGGIDDAQKVYYRTVNGSAVGGTHFTHAASTVTFAAGETSRTVSITEQGANAAHSGKPATAFSNANRTYQLEIYKVEGGGTITGGVSRATRTMTGNIGISKALYTTEVSSKQESAANDGKGWHISDNSSNGPPLLTGRSGDNKSFAVNPIDRFTAEKTYLADTATAYTYHYMLCTPYEDDDGWEHTWVGPAPAAVNNPSAKNDGTPIPIDSTAGTAYYTASFELFNKNVFPGGYYKFPQPGQGVKIDATGGELGKPYQALYGSGQSETNKFNGYDYLVIPPNGSVNVHFGTCGVDQDHWYFNGLLDYVRPLDAREPQLVGVAPMAGGTYKPGDTVTIALVFDEIVDSANSTLSSVSLNTTYGTMTYAGGADTNVLYFTGTVPESASGTVTVNSIANAASIKDMCEQTGTNSGGGGSGSITVDNTKPTVSIAKSDITNGTAKGTITAADQSSLKYTWTQSADMPVSGWISCDSGTVAQTRQTSGTWYLHALAERSDNGTSQYTNASFDFNTTASPLPALTVSADNTEWAHSRNINVARTPAAAAVTYTGPQSGTATGGTVNVTQNGLYIFMLASGGETITEMVSVGRLDAVAPTLTLREPGGTDAVYNTLTFGADAADNLSGIATVEYAVTATSAVPGSGWAALSGSGGSYTGSYTETSSATKTIKYIHVRATDVAGNVTTKTSAAYTVVKAGAAAAPTITLTGAPSDWVKGPVSLSWTVTNAGAGGATVNLNGSTSAAKSGTLAATGNGLYSVTVTDQNGVSASASLLVDKIDAEAPILTGLTASKDWSSTVTLAGVTDDRTPLPDASGTTTGYGGSGLKTQEWKLGSGSYTTFTGNSFAVTATGTYTVCLTDKAGNQNEYTVLVSQVDATAPAVTVGTPATGWASTAQNIAVTYSDSQSGINTAQYAITTTNSGAKPTTLAPLPTSGQSVSVSTSGEQYIYYKVTDKAGNVTDGYSGAIMVDTQAPTLTVTGGKTAVLATTNLRIDVERSFGSSGGKVQVFRDEALVKTLGASENNFIISSESGKFKVTATSNAGKSISEEFDVYLITMNGNGSSTGKNQKVVGGGTASQPGASAPTRKGYTLTGWNKGGVAYNFTTPVTGNITLDAVWALDTPTVSLAVDKAEITYDSSNTVATLTATPRHAAADVTYTYEWYRGNTKLEGTGSTMPLTDVAHSGSYTVKVIASAGGLSSTQVTSNAVSVTINKANTEITTKPTASGITYGQSLSESTLDGGVGSVAANSFLGRVASLFTTPTPVAGAFSWTSGSTTPAVVNSNTTLYSVTFTPTDTANYNASTATITLAVGKKTLTPSVNTVGNKVYDGNTTATGTIALAGAVLGESPTASGTFAFTNAAAGANKPVNVSNIALADTWGNNYALSVDSLANITTTATITPKTVGLTWHGYTGLVYNTNAVNVTATATGLVTPDNCTVTVTGGAQTNAGTYTATATALSNANYALPTATTQAYTIAKAPVTFAVTNDTHIYDASAKAATVAQTASETPDVSGKFTVHYEQSGSTVASPTNKGQYDILVTITNANFKHSGQSDSVSAFKVGTLTIDGTPYPDADTMTWPTAADITYGETLGDSTLTGGDQAAKGSYTWENGTAVPTVTNSGYTVVFTPTDGNYAPVEHTVSITVTKATPALTVPTAEGITYGDTLAKSTLSGGSASATYNGVANTEVPGSYTWTTPATMPAVADSGTTDYALTFTPDDTDNYSVVGTGKIKLAIAQKPIGITWAGHTALVYNGAPVSVTATATGLVTPDSCAITVNGGNETDAGTHTATATAVSNSNYVLPDTDLTQNYTIAKAPVSFVVSDNTHDYDTTAKAATVAQTASETPDVSGNFTVSYEKDGNAVPNPINMGIYSVFVELTNPNFRHKDKVDSASKIQVGLLTINGMEYPNVETMTWPTAESITYGQTLGDSTLTGGSEDSAGDYTWSFPATVPTVTNDGYSVVFTPTDTNYSPMEKVIDLAVTKATPTLALPTTTGITYGETLTDSTLTGGSASATYNGVANIDVPGSYAWTVSTTMPSVADSDSTDYAITFTPTDTDNYNVVTTGQVKLVVAQREAALRWSGHADLVYTGNPVAVTVAVTNLVGADSCTVTVTGGTQTNAGDYTAEATVLDNGNYKLPANVEQAYTIAKAPVTFAVTANVHEYNATAKTAMVAQTAGETPGVAGKFTVSYAKDGNPVATPTNAGVYDVLATLTDANFKHKDKADTVREIKVGALTIIGVKYPQADTMTWPTAADITYGETLGDSTLTGGDQAAKGSYTWENGTAVPTVTNSGYTVVFTPTDGNYAPVEHTVSITVTKATPALTVPTAEGIAYGDTLAKSTLSGGSAQAPYNGTDKTVPGKYTWTTPATMPAVSDSGTTDYSITFTPDDTANYNVVGTGKIKLAVAQKPIGLTWAGHTGLVYTASPVSVTATATGLVGSDSCTVTVADGTKTDAGDHIATATALSNPNYKLPATPTQAYTIAKKPINVLWSDLFPTYSGTQKYPTVALDGVVNGEDCIVLSTGSASAGNAGRYKVVAALQGTRSSNYTMQNPNEILVIQPAPVNVSLSDYSYKWDGTAKYATVTATPDAPLTVTYKLAGNEVAAPTEEGIYDIIVALDGKNYRFADGTDGKARRMGALTIYKEKPPELYTITFDKGAEDAVGTAPTLPPSVRDTTHILPSNTFLRAGHAFVGWKYGETLYQPGARFTQPANNNTVFTAQWEAATYDIGGVVDQDGKPVANVRVVLMRGAEQVAETATNQIGEYHFNNVLPGLYNLVASKPSPDGVGDIIMTIMVEVKASDIEQANITLPSGKTNSIVEVAPGTPKIIVGNLDQTFRNTEGNDFTTEDKEVVNKGGTVEIKFKAEEKQESEIAGDVAEIAKEAGRAKVGLYLALDVEKTVTQPTDPATPDEEPSSDTTSVPETSVLLESVIPLPSDLQGKQSYIVYRVHEGTVESLTTGTDSGERIEVSEDKTTLTLYAQKFSTYAIAYTEKSSGGGGSDDGGGSDSKPILPELPELPKQPETALPVPPVEKPGAVTNPGVTQPDNGDKPEPDGGKLDGNSKPADDGAEQTPNEKDNIQRQKDEILDALEEAIASLPDSLTDEERQAAIDELTRIVEAAVAAIAALDENADPAEGDRIVKQAIADMHSIVKQAQATANSRQGTPFVLGSALLALAAVLLAVFALLKRKDKRRKLFSIIFAALSIAAFLLTTGWNGFALANPWTLVVAAFVICTLLGVFGWYSKEEDEDTATN